MKKLAALLLCLVAPLALAAVLSEKEFTAEFVRRAQAARPDTAFTVVAPLNVKTKSKDGFEGTIFLDNGYAQYESDPALLQRILEARVASLDLTLESAAPQPNGAILAVVKPVDYIATVTKQQKAAGVDRDMKLSLIYENLNEDMFVVYVYDTEAAMRMLAPGDLKEAGVAREDLRALAAKNLAAYFENKRVRIERLDAGPEAKVYLLGLDENYEASVLLIDSFWKDRKFDVKGEPVVFVPARNVVLVTGSEDAEGLRVAKYVAAEGYKELGYAISPHGYRRVAGKWQRFE